jgi:uridine kinase
MKHLLRIHCKNNKISQNFELGTTILEVYDKIKPEMPRRPLCALVNNKVEGLKFRSFSSK